MTTVSRPRILAIATVALLLSASVRPAARPPTAPIPR